MKDLILGHSLSLKGICIVKGNRLNNDLSGIATVLITSLGDCTIELEFEIEDFIQATSKKKSDTSWSTYIPNSMNFVEETITIETELGTLTTTGNRIRKYGDIIGAVINPTVSPRQAVFQPSKNPATSIAFWCMPIINYISLFEQNNLAKHPLAVLESQGFPSIKFEFEKEIAFIQPVDDFNERVKELTSGDKPANITARMVGNANFSDPEVAFDRLPIDLLSLLGFIMGHEVGFSWIELYDINGNLVNMVFLGAGRPTYLKGHSSLIRPAAISEVMNLFLSSTHVGNTDFRMAMRHLARAGLRNQMLNDTLYYVCLALELLCNYNGVAVIDLKKALDPALANDVESILKKASTDIRAKTILTNDPSIKDILKQIADRALNAAGKENKFGLAVAELIKKYDFVDTDIADAYYASHSFSQDTWIDAISYYRGTVAHTGYFDTTSGKVKIEEVAPLVFHLHDLAVRVILKMLGYTQYYQPSGKASNRIYEELVDWVSSTTSAEALGYD